MIIRSVGSAQLASKVSRDFREKKCCQKTLHGAHHKQKVLGDMNLEGLSLTLKEQLAEKSTWCVNILEDCRRRFQLLHTPGIEPGPEAKLLTATL